MWRRVPVLCSARCGAADQDPGLGQVPHINNVQQLLPLIDAGQQPLPDVIYLRDDLLLLIVDPPARSSYHGFLLHGAPSPGDAPRLGALVQDQFYKPGTHFQSIQLHRRAHYCAQAHLVGSNHVSHQLEILPSQLASDICA